MYMLLPGAVLYAIMKPGQKTEAEQRADLEAKYSHNIRKNVGQREAMQKRDARAAMFDARRVPAGRRAGTLTT